MKIDTQTLEDHQIKLTVEVEPQALEDAKQRAARQLARRVKVPGFRPGKAPYPVIVRQLGEAAILEEAVDFLVKEVYPKAIDETGIKPYGPGTLENIASMDPPVLEFLIPLEAEVILGEYRSVQKPYEPKEVADQDIENVLDDLRDRQAILEPADRPAQEGDLVYIRMSAVRNHPDERQEAALIRERSLPVLIKTEKDQDETGEWPFPGFSRRLIGVSAGDEQTFPYTFGEDSEFVSLRGVEAEFRLTVEEIKSRALPELSDEFAASVGEYENLEALRTDIRSSLESQFQETYNQSYDDELLDELVSQSAVKYPPQMLEREVEGVIDNLKHRLEHQNMDLDLYLKTRNMDMDALRAEAAQAAETRLKRSLVLMEIAKQENVQVDQQELQSETVRTMNSLSQSLSKKEARKLSDQNIVSNLVGNIMMDLLTRRTIEHVREIASGRSFKAEEASIGDEALVEDTPGSVEGLPVEEEVQVEAPAANGEVAAAQDHQEASEPSSKQEANG